MKIRSILCFLIIFSIEAILIKANAQTTVVVGYSPSDYANLKNAFNAINNGILTGHVIIQVKNGSMLTSSAVINASGTGAANYDSVLIYPIDTVLLTGNFDDGIIKLDGANNVTIDGRINQTGTFNGLTIKNNYTGSSAEAILFLNGSNHNTVKYTNLTASMLPNSQGNYTGVVSFFSTSSYNTISNCDIYGTGPVGCSGILSYATSSYSEFIAHNEILNNNFYNFYNGNGYMIYLYGTNAAWNISGNSFYQSDTIPLYASTSPTAIKIEEDPWGPASALNNFIISNNKIGGTSPNCGGTPWTYDSLNSYGAFNAISLEFGNSYSNVIEGNIIKNFSLNNFSFTGMKLSGIILSEVKGNIIGDSIGKGSITTNKSAYGIHNAYTLDSIFVTNNFIGSITAKSNIIGINSVYYAAYNLIGSRTTPHSIECTGNTNVELYGIKNSQIVDHNQIRNLTSSAVGYTSGSTHYFPMYGINSNIISNNYVSNLYVSDTTSIYSRVYGIYGNGYNSRVFNNFVQHLRKAPNAFGLIQGIYSPDTCYNNIVSIGDEDSTSWEIIGIAAKKCFNNTVYISGWNNRLFSNSTAHVSYGDPYVPPLPIRNNLFVNTRKNTSSAKGFNLCTKHYGNISYSKNQYYTGNIYDTIVMAFNTNTYYTFNSWRFQNETTAISANPMLINAGDSILAFSYKPTASNTGVLINMITEDYFGNTRLNPPTIGAIERWATYNIFDSLVVAACEQYEFNGQVLTNSGTYTDTIHHSNGLDTIATLNLIVNNNYTTSINHVGCESVNINGQSYNFTGIFHEIHTTVLGCDSTIDHYIIINSPPNNYVSQIANNLSAYYTGGTYQWYNCDSAFILIAGATNSFYDAPVNGSYAVVITSSEGCIDTSACYTVSSVVGIDETNANSFYLFPNPANNILNLQTAIPLNIQIYSIDGRLLISNKVLNNTSFDMTDYAKGMYLLKASDNYGNIYSRKFLNE